MSGVKPITSYFKVLTKDELEIKELIDSQSSSLSRVISNQSARTRSTLSSKVYDSYIDLTKEPEESLPALADYSSDDGDNDDVVPVALATPTVVQNYSDHAVPLTNLMLRMNLITLLTADQRTDILIIVDMNNSE